TVRHCKPFHSDSRVILKPTVEQMIADKSMFLSAARSLWKRRDNSRSTMVSFMASALRRPGFFPQSELIREPPAFVLP
ncbi:Hypothetical predicted protein, partial [Scomber scombrus]